MNIVRNYSPRFRDIITYAYSVHLYHTIFFGGTKFEGRSGGFFAFLDLQQLGGWRETLFYFVEPAKMTFLNTTSLYRGC